MFTAPAQWRPIKTMETVLNAAASVVPENFRLRFSVHSILYPMLETDYIYKIAPPWLANHVSEFHLASFIVNT